MQNKVDLLENLTDVEVEYLRMLSLRLNIQNQRSTSYPIWKICDIEKVYGVDEVNAEGHCIVNMDTDEVYYDCSSVVNRINQIYLNENINESNIDKKSMKSLYDFIVDVLGREEYKLFYYMENIKVYESFLTEDAAEAYLQENKHKYTENVYIYVDSAYGNTEIMMLLDILKKLRVED